MLNSTRITKSSSVYPCQSAVLLQKSATFCPTFIFLSYAIGWISCLSFWLLQGTEKNTDDKEKTSWSHSNIKAHFSLDQLCQGRCKHFTLRAVISAPLVTDHWKKPMAGPPSSGRITVCLTVFCQDGHFYWSSKEKCLLPASTFQWHAFKHRQKSIREDVGFQGLPGRTNHTLPVAPVTRLCSASESSAGNRNQFLLAESRYPLEFWFVHYRRGFG